MLNQRFIVKNFLISFFCSCLIACVATHSPTDKITLSPNKPSTLLAQTHQKTKQTQQSPLNVAKYFIDTQHYKLATQQLQAIKPKTDSVYLLLSQIAMRMQDLTKANQWLYQISKETLTRQELLDYYQLRGKINFAYQKKNAAAIYWLEGFRLANQLKIKKQFAKQLIAILPTLPQTNNDSTAPYLVQAQTLEHFASLKDCIRKIIKHNASNSCNTNNTLQRYTTLFESIKKQHAYQHSQTKKTAQWNRVAVLLPLSGEHKIAGKTIQQGMLHSDLIHDSTVSNMDFYDTNKAASISSLYSDIISKQYSAVIGPLLKKNIKILQQDYPTPPIPTLNLNYLSKPKSTMYQLSLLSSKEIVDLSQLAQEQGYKQALILYSNSNRNSYEELKHHWILSGKKIMGSVAYSSQDSTNQLIKKSLFDNQNNTLRHDFDIIFLLLNQSTTEQVIPVINDYYNANLPIFVHSQAVNLTSLPNYDLNGITFCQQPILMPYNHQYSHFNLLTDNQSPNLIKLLGLGADASQFAQLQINPQAYSGATGKLTLDSHNRYIPTLECAHYANNHLRPIHTHETT